MTETMSITSKTSLILDLPPSCMQICPAHPDYFVIGTYNLEKEDDGKPQADETTNTTQEGEFNEPKKAQNRNGSLVVFKKDGSELTNVQTIFQPSALLDIRFHPSGGKEDTLAVVSSTGTLAIFHMDPEASPEKPLHQLISSRCDDLGEDVLFLQCQWHPSMDSVIGVTLSTGGVRLLHLDNDWNIAGFEDIDIENSLEAWSIAFAPQPDSEATPKPTTVYVGGDDSMLRYNSYVISSEENSLSVESSFGPITIKGRHDAGVTAILPLSIHDAEGGRLVITGSYDDHIRLFSIHDPATSYGMKRVQLHVEENLGGGVWRLDMVDSKVSEAEMKIQILASCMYAGSRLIELRREDEGIWSCSVLARFEEHQSMNYACAVVPRREVSSKLECISTSFYDKLLCLWEYPI